MEIFLEIYGIYREPYFIYLCDTPLLLILNIQGEMFTLFVIALKSCIRKKKYIHSYMNIELVLGI